MTDNTEVPNEGRDDDAPQPETTFEDLRQAQNTLYQERKRVTFELPENLASQLPNDEIWFEIRMLRPAEFDEVEASIMDVDQNSRGQERSINTTALKVGLIEKGVEECSMSDWKATERHINALPKDIRDELADAVDDFQKLDEHERIGFR